MHDSDTESSNSLTEKTVLKPHPESWKSLVLILVICLVAVPLVVLITITVVLPRTGNQSCSNGDGDLKSVTDTSSSQSPETSILKSAPCEDDCIWYRGKCYYFSEDRDTWTNSQSFCASHNASLVHIDDETELRFLNRFKGKDNHWIGLRWNITNNGWTWTNGTLYTEHLFPIQSMSGKHDESEYVFLNHEGVKSGNEIYKKKWICSRSSFFGMNLRETDKN